jgi:hypothetical protein
MRASHVSARAATALQGGDARAAISVLYRAANHSMNFASRLSMRSLKSTLLISLFVGLAYCTQSKASDVQSSSPISAGAHTRLICESVAGNGKRSCDGLCAAHGNTCTGVTSPTNPPPSCADENVPFVMCRCCHIGN